MHKMIGVKELTPSPNNNRTTFDLDSLSASIKEVGIIEPLVVRRQRRAIRSSAASGDGKPRRRPSSPKCLASCVS